MDRRNKLIGVRVDKIGKVWDKVGSYLLFNPEEEAFNQAQL